MKNVTEKKKSKSKPKGFVMKEIPDDDEQQKKKRNNVGLLKIFLKIRAQTVKAHPITTRPKKEVLNEAEVREEMDDEVTDTKDET